MSGSRRESRSWSGRAIRSSAAAMLGAATVAVVLAAPAAAAQPNHQACLGEDIRNYAQGGSMFGGFVAGMAVVDGVGQEIQAHLAGDIPEDVQPNSCND